MTEKELLKKYQELYELQEKKTIFIEEQGLTLEYLRWASKYEKQKQ